METELRQRNLNCGMEEESDGENCVSDNMCLAEQKSLSRILVALDVHLTKRMGICSDRTKPLGYLRPLMKLLELSCHGIPWIIGNILALFFYKDVITLGILVNLFYALMFDLLVVAVLKMCFRRSRPAHNKMDMFATVSIDNFSFPSGHATRAAMVTFFFISHFYMGLFSMCLMVFWAGSVALSRVFLGRHHIGDVMFGLLVGYLQYRFVTIYSIPTPTCISMINTFVTV